MLRDFFIDQFFNITITFKSILHDIGSIELEDLSGAIFVINRSSIEVSRSKEELVITFFVGFDGVRSIRVLDIVDSDNSLFVVDGLCPLDDAEYSKNFKSKKNRTGLIYLDLFIALQTFRFFKGGENFKICAAVVVAYKAVESGSPGMLQLATEIINECDKLLLLCKYADSPRRNKEHLRVSLMCAEWHVYFALGDFIKFEKIQEKMFSVVRETANFFTPSYLICLSLSFYALTKAILKDEEQFLLTLDVAYNVYKRAVLDSSVNNITWFRELSVPHAMVANIIKMRDNWAEVTLESQLTRDIFNTSVRVNGDVADRLFESYKSNFSKD